MVGLGLTFDDLLLLPDYSDFRRDDIDLTIRLSQNITLATPLISSPMDTVTESALAKALAKAGGLGIIHRSLSIEKQVSEVQKVKSAGFLVGAALGPGKDLEERVGSLVKARVDTVVVDSAHGFSKNIIEAVAFLKKNHPKLVVIGGNVATYEGAKALISAGADALRVGMGPGSICTTRVISGVGVPQVTAIKETLRAAKIKKIPIIADGGIKCSGDIVKALAMGASAVILGSLFGSCLEAPGKTLVLKKEQVPQRFLSIFNGKQKAMKFKEYRGMGSPAALKTGGATRYGQENRKSGKALIAEGVEGLVPIKGTVSEVVEQLTGGLRSGMYYIGAKNISQLWRKAKFIQITQASWQESHPHSILIVNPGDNYTSSG